MKVSETRFSFPIASVTAPAGTKKLIILELLTGFTSKVNTRLFPVVEKFTIVPLTAVMSAAENPTGVSDQVATIETGLAVVKPPFVTSADLKTTEGGAMSFVNEKVVAAKLLFPALSVAMF